MAELGTWLVDITNNESHWSPSQSIKSGAVGSVKRRLSERAIDSAYAIVA